MLSLLEAYEILAREVKPLGDEVVSLQEGPRSRFIPRGPGTKCISML